MTVLFWEKASVQASSLHASTTKSGIAFTSKQKSCPPLHRHLLHHHHRHHHLAFLFLLSFFFVGQNACGFVLDVFVVFASPRCRRSRAVYGSLFALVQLWWRWGRRLLRQRTDHRPDRPQRLHLLPVSNTLLHTRGLTLFTSRVATVKVLDITPSLRWTSQLCHLLPPPPVKMLLGVSSSLCRV